MIRVGALDSKGLASAAAATYYFRLAPPSCNTTRVLAGSSAHAKAVGEQTESDTITVSRR